MKSLVVRLYRTSGHGDTGTVVAGIVEDPETGRQLAFHDPQELWAAINGATGDPLRAPDGKPGDDTDTSPHHER